MNFTRITKVINNDIMILKMVVDNTITSSLSPSLLSLSSSLPLTIICPLNGQDFIITSLPNINSDDYESLQTLLSSLSLLTSSSSSYSKFNYLKEYYKGIIMSILSLLLFIIIIPLLRSRISSSIFYWPYI